MSTATVTVTTLLFTSGAEALGRSALVITCAPRRRAADLIARVRTLPGADRLPAVLLVAVNAVDARRRPARCG